MNHPTSWTPHGDCHACQIVRNYLISKRPVEIGISIHNGKPIYWYGDFLNGLPGLPVQCFPAEETVNWAIKHGLAVLSNAPRQVSTRSGDNLQAEVRP